MNNTAVPEYLSNNGLLLKFGSQVSTKPSINLSSLIRCKTRTLGLRYVELFRVI